MVSIKQVISSLIPPNEVDLFNLDIANRPVGELSPGDFISGQNIIVFSGPPLFSQARRNTDLLKPVGLVTSLSLSIMKQYLRWDELGYKFSRHVPNKINYAMSMDKVLSNKGNLLYFLYQWSILYFIKKNKADLSFYDSPGAALNSDALGKFYQLNMSSELFNAPFGLLVISMDNYYDIQDAQYFELCKIASKSNMYSPNPILQDNCQILLTKVRPALGPNGLEIAVKKKFKDFSIPDPSGMLKKIAGIFGADIYPSAKDKRLPPGSVQDKMAFAAKGVPESEYNQMLIDGTIEKLPSPLYPDTRVQFKGEVNQNDLSFRSALSADTQQVLISKSLLSANPISLSSANA